MERTWPWEVNDALWERVQPLIPARPPHPKGVRRTGRHPVGMAKPGWDND